MPALFIGVAPVDTDISLEWAQGENSAIPPEVFQSIIRPSSQGDIGLWPRHVEYPQALKDGMFFVISLCLFTQHQPHDEYEWDGWLHQWVKGEYEVIQSMDGGRVPERISLRFRRGLSSCFLHVTVEDDEHDCIESHVDLCAQGLSCSADYRPMVFFGKKGALDISV